MDKGYKVVPVSDVIQNDWNPNVLPPELYKKLLAGITDLFSSEKDIPPIVVRPHPAIADKYEIIDGEHRWRAFQDLNKEDIPVFVIDVDTTTAQVLTSTLNYIKGSPSVDKQAEYLRRLSDSNVTFDFLAKYLPQSEFDLRMMAESFGVEFKYARGLGGDDLAAQREAEKESNFVTLEFVVSVAQAEVVEKEVSRLSATLDGKNVRGRALEFMAVNSTLTPLNDAVNAFAENQEAAVQENPKKKRLKFKKVDKAVETEA